MTVRTPTKVLRPCLLVVRLVYFSAKIQGTVAEKRIFEKYYYRNMQNSALRIIDIPGILERYALN